MNHYLEQVDSGLTKKSVILPGGLIVDSDGEKIRPVKAKERPSCYTHSGIKLAIETFKLEKETKKSYYFMNKDSQN